MRAMAAAVLERAFSMHAGLASGSSSSCLASSRAAWAAWHTAAASTPGNASATLAAPCSRPIAAAVAVGIGRRQRAPAAGGQQRSVCGRGFRTTAISALAAALAEPLLEGLDSDVEGDGEPEEAAGPAPPPVCLRESQHSSSVLLDAYSDGTGSSSSSCSFDEGTVEASSRRRRGRPKGAAKRPLGMDDVQALAAELLQPLAGQAAAASSGLQAAAAPALELPPLPVPNLGYACQNVALRRRRGRAAVITNRSCWRRTFDARGLAHISQMALANCLDLLRVLAWNREAGIRLYRVSSGLLPWALGGEYQLEQLPDYQAIAAALAAAGELARASGQRLTAHPPHYVKLASRDAELVGRSIRLLDMQAQVFDLMGFTASLANKLNIHVGGCYGSKRSALRRFAAAYRRLSPSAAARLAVENDDRPNSFSVADLLPLHAETGVCITFDAHHHRFCSGGWRREDALNAALATWPAGVRPVVHWSEPPECPRRARTHPHAHSAFVFGPISLHGREAEVDIMIESKAAEQALLLYRDKLLPLYRAGLLPADGDALWEQPLGTEQVITLAAGRAAAVVAAGPL